jgi:hypothetical protein
MQVINVFRTNLEINSASLYLFASEFLVAEIQDEKKRGLFSPRLITRFLQDSL